MISLSDIAAELRAGNNYLIYCHVRPDGDAAGSAGALTLGLRALGKTAFVAPHPTVMDRFAAYIEPYYAPADFVPALSLSVDTPGPGQLVGRDGTTPVIDIAIDHHGSNALYAKRSYVEGDSASCGELVYALLLELGVTIDRAMAEALYCAITTDTGCFRTEVTTPRSLRIAATLRETGFDAYGLTHRLFEVKSPARLRLESAIFTAMSYPRPDTACVVVDRAMLERCGVTENDLDKISMQLTAAEGVRYGIMLRELEPGRWKISVRTDGSVSAGAVAGIYPGGGGHKDSGGAVAKGDPAELTERLYAALLHLIP